jgi:hypothetical protein
VKIKGKTTVPKGESTGIFTLEASNDAAVKAEAPIKVTATSSGFDGKVESKFKVTIEESLDTKKARREDFVTKAGKQLKAAKDGIKKIEDQLAEATEDFKISFGKRDSALNKQAKEAQCRLDKIKAADLTQWEQEKVGVTSAIDALEASVESARRALDNHLKKKQG